MVKEMESKVWKKKTKADENDIQEYEVEITYTYKTTKTLEDLESEIKMKEDEIKRLQDELDVLKSDLNKIKVIK
jgi:SMC interacting uncharacterized protein involved in chromosome segregation